MSDPNATVDGNSRPSTPTPNSNAAASASLRLAVLDADAATKTSIAVGARANDPSAFIDRRTASSVVSIRLSTTPHSHAAAFALKSCAKTFRIAATSADAGGASSRTAAPPTNRARHSASNDPAMDAPACSNAPRVARVAVSGLRNAVATSKHAPVALRRLSRDASARAAAASARESVAAAPVIVIASTSRSPSPSPRELAWSTVARASAHVDAARETAASDVETRAASTAASNRRRNASAASAASIVVHPAAVTTPRSDATFAAACASSATMSSSREGARKTPKVPCHMVPSAS